MCARAHELRSNRAAIVGESKATDRHKELQLMYDLPVTADADFKCELVEVAFSTWVTALALKAHIRYTSSVKKDKHALRHDVQKVLEETRPFGFDVDKPQAVLPVVKTFIKKALRLKV